MKRLAFLFLLLAPPAFAGQILEQSIATQVTLKFVDATDGVTAETGLTVTTFDCNLVKHADSGMAVTALTVTASGGSNDSAHLADGIYSLELTVTDTNTLGRLDLYCQCSGAAPYEAHFDVSDIASIDDVWEHPASDIGTSGSIGLQLKTNADVPTSQYSVIGQYTTLATVASQTSVTLTDGASDDNAYNGWIALIQDDSDSNQKTRLYVEDYVGSTKTIMFRTFPATSFTIAAGDGIKLVPDQNADIFGGYPIHAGIAGSATTTTIVLDGAASGTDDWYNDKRIRIVSGTGAGQSAIIRDYTGASKSAAIFCEGSSAGNWKFTPDSTSVFIIEARNK